MFIRKKSEAYASCSEFEITFLKVQNGHRISDRRAAIGLLFCRLRQGEEQFSSLRDICKLPDLDFHIMKMRTPRICLY